MDTTKKWYASKGVWTGIVTALFGIYAIVGQVAAAQFGHPLPPVPPLVLTLLGAFGIYARATADAKIG